MTHLRMAVAAALIISVLLPSGYSALAAQNDRSERQLAAQCRAELRKCDSHCRLVYESKRARRVCYDRCEDSHFACKARPI